MIGFTGWNPEGGVETGEMGFRFGGFARFAVQMTEVEGGDVMGEAMSHFLRRLWRAGDLSDAQRRKWTYSVMYEG